MPNCPYLNFGIEVKAALTKRGLVQRAYLSLGSNVGDRRGSLSAALGELESSDDVEIVAVSSLYRAEPLGMGPDAEWFLNCAAAVDTALEPLELLDRLEGIEMRLGRNSKGLFAPRTLDMDILLYGDHIVVLPRLSIPHPRMAERRFVLEPLCELAPTAAHPLLKTTIAALASRVAGQKVLCEGRLRS